MVDCIYKYDTEPGSRREVRKNRIMQAIGPGKAVKLKSRIVLIRCIIGNIGAKYLEIS